MYADILTESGLQSFWYWVLVVLVWGRTLQVTLGIPLGMMRMADKGDKIAQKDALMLLCRYTHQMTYDFQQHGPFRVLLISFVLTSLVSLAFLYDIALLQGVFFLASPLIVIGGIGVHYAYQLRDPQPDWKRISDVYKNFYRLKIVIIAVFSFVLLSWILFLEIRPYLETS